MSDGSDNRPKPGPCPDPALIAAHAERRLEGPEAARIDAHIASCPVCSEVFAATLRFGLEDEEGPPVAAVAVAGRRSPGHRPAFRVLAASLAAAAALVVGFLLWRYSATAPRSEERVARVATPTPGLAAPSPPGPVSQGPGEIGPDTTRGPALARGESGRRAPVPSPPETHGAEPVSPPTPAELAPAPPERPSTRTETPLAQSPVPPSAEPAETTPRETPVAGRPGTEQEEALTHRREEITVVSASRVAQKIVDAPATMSVITGERLETAPQQNIADALRAVPGLNVIQTGARDFNLTARQATSTLSTSTLVTVDGRSVYLDFFGLVLWDFVPSPSSGDIDQIEVVRGPASVVWGANAVNGLVNFITKRPRGRPGFGLVLGAGLFDRDGGSRAASGDGHQLDGGFSYADAPNDTWSYKLNAGYYFSDPYSRPVGTVPLDCHPLGVVPCRDATGAAVPGGIPIGGAPYPADADAPGAFENQGTSQPKIDVRVDQDLANGGRLLYEAGYGGTRGIVHTGIGPFNLEGGSHMSYGRVSYNKGALRLGLFANLLDAEAPNLLVSDPDTLAPILLGFKTQTYDLEFGNTNVMGAHNTLTYGANYRRNNFEISLAEGPDRNELGGFALWEYFARRFRLSAGVRADKFGNLDKVVWSPRVSVMLKPTPDQSIRASYNRAFVAPSFIHNHLDQNIQFPTPVDLTPLAQAVPPLAPLVPPPFLLTVNAFGNPELREQSTDAFELAYNATFRKTTLSLAAYLSTNDNSFNFTYLYPPGTPGYPAPTYYSPDNPARGVTLPTPTAPAMPITLSPILMGALAQVPPALGGPIHLPDKVATYLNLGPIRNKGLELSIDHRLTPEVSFFANYSWQDTPQILEADPRPIPYPPNEVGIPPAHRFNAGLGYDGPRLFLNADVNYASRALWVDVLTAEYAGFTDPYASLNATLGLKLANGKVRLALKGTNLANERIQQHVFGDLLKRSLVLEVRFFSR